MNLVGLTVGNRQKIVANDHKNNTQNISKWQYPVVEMNKYPAIAMLSPFTKSPHQRYKQGHKRGPSASVPTFLPAKNLFSAAFRPLSQ